MNRPVPPPPPAAPVGRVEDDALLRGLGRYTADYGIGARDVVGAGVAGAPLVARFVRAGHAHARLLALDLSAARAVEGVVAVLGADDLAGLLPREPGPIDQVRNRDGSTTPVPSRPALARERVRFVGEAYALVLARDEGAAADGAEMVAAEFEALPARADLEGAAASLHDALPDDLGFDWCGGDPEATARAVAGAAHVVRARLRVPRILGAPLEPMTALANYDPDAAGWTLVTPSQGAHAIRRELAEGYLGVDPARLRVVTPDVGGAFGIRIHALPEQAALLAAARLVGAPVLWRAERTESNLCEPHARDFLVEAELALDADGRFLGLRAEALCGLGAYVHPGARATPTASLLFGLQGAYRIPAVSLRVRGLYTNATPTGPFRGAGQPEGTYVLERLVDRAARALDLPPAELRRRNALDPAGGPHVAAATGHRVEDCDAAALLARAAAWLDAPFPDEGGRLRGRGVALYLKVNGMGRQERAEVAVDPATGMVTAAIGSQSNGQGHATTFAALAAARLGLERDAVTVVQGDTARLGFGTGTGASSALGTTGTGVARSCAELLATAREAAAAMLDAPATALAYEAGSFRLPGTNRFLTLREIAAVRPDGLVGRSEVGVNLTYTVGCHACRVDVDPETGEVEILDYAAFDDLGPLLQPAIAGGQIHGGVANGIGQALGEDVRYDAEGQPVTTTFLDYWLPRATDVPDIGGAIVETPAARTDLGVRGAGEAGAIASMAAIVNAVDDALGGRADLEAPLTPHRVWRALRASGPTND